MPIWIGYIKMAEEAVWKGKRRIGGGIFGGATTAPTTRVLGGQQRGTEKASAAMRKKLIAGQPAQTGYEEERPRLEVDSEEKPPPKSPQDPARGLFKQQGTTPYDLQFSMKLASVDFFADGMGAEADPGFISAWDIGSDTMPLNAPLPGNLNEAAHLGRWLDANETHIRLDEVGRMFYLGDELGENSTIPIELARKLGLQVGDPENFDQRGVELLGAGTPGFTEERLGQVKLTPNDLQLIREQIGRQDSMRQWVTDMTDMGLTQQGEAFKQDTISNLNAMQTQLEDGFNRNMAYIKSQYDVRLAEVQGAEQRRGARVAGEESRASLTHEFSLRQVELEDEYHRQKGLAEQQRVIMLDKIEVQMEAEKALMDREAEIRIDFRQAELEYQQIEAELDRNLEYGRLDEVIRNNTALHMLDAQRNELAQDKLKIEMVTQIASNPAFLYYAKQSGMLDILASALGGRDSANEMYDALSTFVPEDVKTNSLNIQSTNRLSTMQQALQNFGVSASRGLSEQQILAEQQGNAPRGVGEARYIKPEVRPGTGADPSLFDFSSEGDLARIERPGQYSTPRAQALPGMEQRGKVPGLMREGELPTEAPEAAAPVPATSSPTPTVTAPQGLNWGADPGSTGGEVSDIPQITAKAKGRFINIGFAPQAADTIVGSIANEINKTMRREGSPSNLVPWYNMHFNRHLDLITENEGFQGKTAQDKTNRETYGIKLIRMA
jgi:hypothetical protein